MIPTLPARWRVGDVSIALTPSGGVDQRSRCLATLLGCTTGAIVMTRTARGKPILVAPTGGACSFAHRGGSSLIAVARGGAVGVDLEVVRGDLDAVEIAGDFFCPAEAVWLHTLPRPQRALGFTALWAVKEAVLKATGRGIVDGLAWPALPGDDVRPLLEGAEQTDLALCGTTVQLRRGSLPGGAEAIACVARIAVA